MRWCGRCELARVGRVVAQRGDGVAAVVQHFARLFEEDGLQVVFVEFASRAPARLVFSVADAPSASNGSVLASSTRRLMTDTDGPTASPCARDVTCRRCASVAAASPCTSELRCTARAAHCASAFAA